MDRFAEKYYPMSPYQYGANNPVINIDINGDSIRVYTETTSNHGLGHVWISIGEGDNLTVYTYGRYDGTNKGIYGSSNSLSNGPGVLVKLDGEAAKVYIDKKASSTKMSVFTVTDIKDEQVARVLNSKFASSNHLPSNPNGEYYNSPSAHIVDEYDLLNNNCATTISDALNAAGSSVLQDFIKLPSRNMGMWKSAPVFRRYNTPSGIQSHFIGKFSYNEKNK